MKIEKSLVSTVIALAFAATFVAPNAAAMPVFAEQAPRSSIENCVAEIAEYADYSGAGRVRHDVDSKKRRVTGYKIMIDTTVYADNGEDIIREYATRCMVTPDEQTTRLVVEQKGA